MKENESKRERILKRTQLVIAIMVGVISLAVGLYNFKNIFFSKKGPGGVVVEIRGENAKVIPQASLEVLRAHGGLVASSQTGFDGKFGKQGMDPGNYSLKVAKAKFQPETFFFSVDPGQTTELNLKLKPASSSVRTAVEEVGASWIKEIGMSRSKSREKSPTEAE